MNNEEVIKDYEEACKTMAEMRFRSLWMSETHYLRELTVWVIKAVVIGAGLVILWK